ncbi:nuclear transport factor 2 family protein [Paracoccaceae bacterium GXU_MW_L88]
MYHSIVEKKIRVLFGEISRGRMEPIFDGFADQFEHRFFGEHALGGARHTMTATRAWYQRLFRLLPEIRFTVNRVAVRGMPWDTMAVVEWSEENRAADDVRSVTNGVHVVWIRWGKITRMLIIPETDRLVATLERLDQAGFSEAKAAPITD